MFSTKLTPETSNKDMNGARNFRQRGMPNVWVSQVNKNIWEFHLNANMHVGGSKIMITVLSWVIKKVIQNYETIYRTIL